MSILKNIKLSSLIYVIVLNGPLFYFSICALLGIRFDTEEGAGIIYKIYMVSLLFLGGFMWIRRAFLGGVKFFPLLILMFYAIVGVWQGYMYHRLFLQMICFSIPATCVALSIKNRDELAEIMKYMDLFLPIFAFAFVYMIKDIYLSSLEGLGSYNQNASYMIAYCFLIDIFLLLYSDNYPKFKLLDNKWYTAFKVALLPYFVVLAFFGGGRGAFITIIVGFLFVITRIKNRISFKKIIIVFLGLLLLVFLVIFVLSRLSSDYLELLNHNYNRITALVADGSIDTSASSGRDEIWKRARMLILDKPLLGYGLFSYLAVSNWPHNIFLEVLLQGGMFLFIILIIILLLSFSKYHRMLKYNQDQIWLVPLMIYAFTELLFSGSYIFQPYFWFSISYIYNYNIKKSVNMIKS